MPHHPDTPPSERPAASPGRVTLGQIVATPGALELLDRCATRLSDLLARHASGKDWGDVAPEDALANDHALIHGGRLLSAYTLIAGVAATRIWIITEWDRSVTTLLRPDEY